MAGVGGRETEAVDASKSLGVAASGERKLLGARELPTDKRVPSENRALAVLDRRGEGLRLAVVAVEQEERLHAESRNIRRLVLREPDVRARRAGESFGGGLTLESDMGELHAGVEVGGSSASTLRNTARASSGLPEARRWLP